MNDAQGDRFSPAESRSPGVVAASGHSLKRNTIYALAGNGVFNLCRVAVVALLAKYATAEIQGTFTYVSIALAGPVVLFCGLELRAAFVADAGGEFSFGAYRALRTIGMGLAAVVLAIAAVWLARDGRSAAHLWFVLGVCGARVFFGLAEVYWGVYQRRERLDLLAWSNVLRGLVLLAPFAIAFLAPKLLGGSVAGADTPDRLMVAAAWGAGAYAAGWAAIWWFFDRRLVVGKPDVDLSWNWGGLRRLARQTFPLGLVILLISLCETVTQSFVKYAAPGDGWADVGYFGAMRIITLGATFLIVQVSTAAGNRLATYYQTDSRAFTQLVLKLTGVALGLGACFLAAAWLFGEWLLRILYTSRYAEHYSDFLLMVAAEGVMLLAVVFGAITTHMRRFWIQVPVHVMVLAATAVGGWMLVTPADPVAGGARTMFLRASVQAVLYLGCVLIGMRRRRRAG